MLLLKNVNWKEKYFYLLKMREYEVGVRLSLSTWKLEGSGLGGLKPGPPRVKEGEKFVLNLLVERKVE